MQPDPATFKPWYKNPTPVAGLLTPLRVVSRREIAFILLASIALFATCASYALTWHKLGVFEQYNVIFDADPNDWIRFFAHGWSTGGFSHPLGPYFFSVPIRALETLGASIGVVNDPLAFRESLALFVSPLLTSLKIPAFYLTFRKLGQTPLDCALLSLLASWAFSSLIFGALPSSYPITGSVISLMILFCLVGLSTGWHCLLPLIMSGVLAVGMTISNLAALGWFSWVRFVAEGNNPLRAFVMAALLSAAVGGLVLSVSNGLSSMRLSEAPSDSVMLSETFVSNYILSPQEGLARLARLPETLGRSFLATLPEKTPSALALKNHNPITFELAYPSAGTTGWLLGVCSIMLLVGGACLAWRAGGVWRWLSLGSALAVLTLGVLYSFVGHNSFLAVQHFQVPTIILLGGWFTLLTRRQLIRWLAAGLLLTLIAADFWMMQTITAWISQDVAFNTP